MEADIVEDDDIAGRQLWSELGFDVVFKDGGVHGRVDDPWRDEAMAAQPSDEGLCLPLTEWRVRAVARALRRPAGALAQLGVGGRLIDEDQTWQGLAEERLSAPDPEFPCLAYISAQLFACS